MRLFSGPHSLLAKAIKHARPRFFRFILFKRDLADPMPDVPDPLGVQIRTLDGPALALAIDQAASADMRDSLVRCARRNGTTYGAWLDGRLVGASMMTSGFIRSRGQLIRRLTPQERYSSDAFVLPEFRGHKVYPLLNDASYRDQASLGATRVYIMVRTNNAASLHVHQRLGARSLGRVTVLAWMLMTFAWQRKLDPAGPGQP